MVLGFGPRYRSPLGEPEEVDEGDFGRSRPPKGAVDNTRGDLGTKAVAFGVAGVVLGWVPILNIVGLVAGIIALAFGALAHVPNAVSGPVNKNRARLALVLGGLTVILFAVSTFVVLRATSVSAGV